MSDDPLVARRSTFSSLRIRNFRLFFIGQLISNIGNWLTLIAQTLLVLELTGSGLALGLLAACQFGPVLILGAWTGLIADRSDKRRLLVIVQSLAMVQSLVLAVLAFIGDPPVVAIYAVAIAGGVAIAFDNPARRAFVTEIVPETAVQNAVSLNSALMTGSRVVGPALAGLMIHTVGYGWTFLADGLSYIAVIGGLAMMTRVDIRPTVAQRGRGQIREGLRYVRGIPELLIPLVMMTIIGSLAFNFQTVMPLLVTRTLGGDGAAFTLVYSVMSVGSLIGALLAARRTSATLGVVVLSAAGFGVSMTLLAATPNLAITFPIGAMVGLTSITFMTASTALIQLRSVATMRGRVLALQAMVFLGSTPIGGPILGLVCQQFGARTGVAVGGAGSIAAAAYGWRAVRRRATSQSAPNSSAVGESVIPVH